jgi:hypothetical protein
MITALIIALILIAIVCVIGQVFLQLVPAPAPVKTIVWAVIAIVSLLILLSVFTGGIDGSSLRFDVD